MAAIIVAGMQKNQCISPMDFPPGYRWRKQATSRSYEQESRHRYREDATCAMKSRV
jgi:hypothetical protein